MNTILQVLKSQRNRVAISLLVILCGCNFLEIDPPRTQLVSASVFETNESANAAVIGIYSRMMESQGMFSILTTTTTGLTSDELINVSTETEFQQFYENAILPSNATVQILWRNAYESIYAANAVLEGLQGSTIAPSLKQQLEGEALFIRAFCHFYLVNVFGDVPWVATTDFQQNTAVSREEVAQVYTSIVADLEDARQRLPEFSGNIMRPTKDAAAALLARTYLYTNQWALAEETASSIIANTAYQLTTVENVFLAGSSEAIWQLQPVAPGYNTYEGNAFVPVDVPTTYELNPELLEAFEGGDERAAWIGNAVDGTFNHYYPFKYKLRQGSQQVLEYYTVFRLAEMYLIRAEARANLNKGSEAIADIDVIRQRAGVSLVSDTNPGATAGEIQTAIAHERRIELFTEWGHRWFDLKRTATLDDVLASKPGWDATDENFPIPLVEIQRNRNMTQNDGY